MRKAIIFTLALAIVCLYSFSLKTTSSVAEFVKDGDGTFSMLSNIEGGATCQSCHSHQSGPIIIKADNAEFVAFGNEYRIDIEVPNSERFTSMEGQFAILNNERLSVGRLVTGTANTDVIQSGNVQFQNTSITIDNYGKRGSIISLYWQAPLEIEEGTSLYIDGLLADMDGTEYGDRSFKGKIDLGENLFSMFSNNIQVYPTQIQNSFNITGIDKLDAEIDIYSIIGNRVFTQTANESIFYIDELESGQYIVVVKQNGKALHSEKIIKL